MTKRKTSPTVALAALLVATSALAVPIQHASLASFEAASAGILVEDFQSTPVGVLAEGVTDLGLFSIDIGTGVTFPQAVAPGNFLDLGIFSPMQAGTPKSITFIFDSPIFGFGADWSSPATGGGIDVEINGTTFFNIGSGVAGAGTGFIGFTDTTPFTQLTLTADGGLTGVGEEFLLDDARLASGSASVPEPTTLLLMGIGGLGVAGLGFKRRRDNS